MPESTLGGLRLTKKKKLVATQHDKYSPTACPKTADGGTASSYGG
jgi:hypothetical protein